MSLTPRQRQDLLRASHSLRAVATLQAGDLSPGGLANIRAALANRELIKVRVRAETPQECDAAAVQIARAIPCELVKRVGRVVVLYRPAQSDDAVGEAVDPPQPGR